MAASIPVHCPPQIITKLREQSVGLRSHTSDPDTCISLRHVSENSCDVILTIAKNSCIFIFSDVYNDFNLNPIRTQSLD